MGSKNTTIKASDDFLLSATLHSASDPKVAILISAGTGFPKEFYYPVAQYLAGKGALVLTYDYRGIAASRSGELVKSDIDIPDWGKLDLAAAIDALEKQAKGLPITHLAHSVGGHLIGFPENHRKVKRHAFVSVGVGYWGHHHKSYWPLEFFFWWPFGQYNLLRYGYIKSGGLWKGESLPPQIFRTWRRWSMNSTYFKPELADRLKPHHFGDVDSPIRSWLFPDDPIATEKASQAVLDCLPGAPAEIVWRKPSQIGVGRIGHDGAFRKGREKLWDEWWEWLSSDITQT